MPSDDLLVFDLEGAERLRAALGAGAVDLSGDHRALDSLLAEAGMILGSDQSAPLHQLARVRSALADLETDLAARIARMADTLANTRAIDELSARIDGCRGSGDGRRLGRLRGERRRLVSQLVGDNAALTGAVLALVGEGMPVLDAVHQVARADRERRTRALVDAEGIDRATATFRISQLDAELTLLLQSGLDWTEASSALSVATALGLDLDAAMARAATDGTDLSDVLGHMAIAENLGLHVDELVSIEQLRTHFATFDDARGGRPDGRVSRRDLEYVLAHPTRFAPAHGRAARAILETPELLHRLDSAAANDEVLAADGFGRTEPDDELISLDDLQAFVIKAQINHVLGPYADRIDVAADPAGSVDGFVSRADLERFLSGTPDLPTPVRAAATDMLDAGLFDRTWLESHRDELAMGAAVVAGAAAAGVMIISAGTATPVVAMGAGALAGTTAGAGTTLAVNASGDAHDPLDGVSGNAVRGGMLGATTAGLPIGFEAVGAATTLPARLAAAADVTSDVATITWAGGADILLPESVEDDVHELAEFVSQVTGPTGLYESAAPVTDD